MSQDNRFSRPQHMPVHTIIQRHRQVPLSLPCPIILPLQKRIERRSPLDTPRLVIPLNHIAHIPNPPLTILTHIHLTTDLRRLTRIRTAHGVELVVRQRGIVERGHGLGSRCEIGRFVGWVRGGDGASVRGCGRGARDGLAEGEEAAG
jgi:hypothetical protein